VTPAPGLYICLVSPHGLIRGRDPELGQDADTGGQVLYVIELARALGERRDVKQVDLITRKIDDASAGPDYAAEIEPLGPKARITRLPFGPSRYLRKELLWGHLDLLVDRALAYFRQQGRAPDVIHGHYADGGYVAGELSRLLAVPQIHTGHALGRAKRARLLEDGMKLESIERQFNMNRRIAVEEKVLASASLIVASTRQEVDEQYGLYDNKRLGRFAVVPPGTDTRRFFPPGKGWTPPPIQRQVDRFLDDPEKPMILAISRAARVKNLSALVEAFGNDAELQELANLVLILGNRDDIQRMEDNPRGVLTELLLALDRHDLYGRVALPKRHRAEDVPELYRLAFRRRGVFVNPGLTEMFGLTLIEAAASGVPIVATRHGGPPDIIKNCRNGLLVNPLKPREIARALLTVLRASRHEWREWSTNGVRGVAQHYTWQAHVDRYLRLVARVLRRQRKTTRRSRPGLSISGPSRLPTVERVLVTDIDDTLIGDRDGLQALLARLEEKREKGAFGIATGRTIDSAMKVLQEWNVTAPDFIVSSVGSEIHYGPNLASDAGWARHIRALWRREALEELFRPLPGLKLQARTSQREFKLSYVVDPASMPAPAEIRRLVRAAGLTATLIHTQGRFLDVLPMRASKGRAVRYLSYKWGLPLNRIVVAGDSGNDEEMLRGDTLAIVVGNHSPELEKLRGSHQVYFSKQRFAWGILEGLDHYHFFGKASASSAARSAS